MDNIKFSAIVVTFNEAHHLKDCISTLGFCEEILVVDLGSTDRSHDVARACGARVIQMRKLPIVEQVHREVISFAKNDWLVLLDPDERLPINIGEHLKEQITKDPTAGVILLPWKFYFRRRQLNTSPWGPLKYKSVVRNRARVEFLEDVHRGWRLKDGYIEATIQEDELKDHVRHYWMDSYPQLLEKHWRYIKQEGASRYRAGERFTWVRCVRQIARAWLDSMVKFQGWRGIQALILAHFYTWYVGASLMSLRSYQKTVTRQPSQAAEHN